MLIRLVILSVVVVSVWRILDMSRLVTVCSGSVCLVDIGYVTVGYTVCSGGVCLVDIGYVMC